MNTTVGVLGSGIVGRTLAAGFRDLGYKVQIGTRSGSVIEGWDGEVGKFADVAAQAELIVLAVKGSAAEEVVATIKDQISGKTIIDTTNPLADKPPDEGVLSLFTTQDHSLMERLQLAAPDASFVKAFCSVGNARMVNPKFEEGQPTMFICGNNSEAKQQVTDILDSFGWQTEDMGGVKSARAIEPLCVLWCIPGMLRNQWTHAYKQLNK